MKKWKVFINYSFEMNGDDRQPPADVIINEEILKRLPNADLDNFEIEEVGEASSYG